MFYKVLKLLIKSRFSRSYLFIILLIFIYSIITIHFGVSDTANFGSYYLAFFFIIFLVSAIYMGGISTTSADRDFLLTSSIENVVLVPAFFISQALASSLIFVSAASASLILLRHDQTALLIGILDIFCMAILPISMSLNMAEQPRPVKIVSAGIALIWILSSYLNFPYGPMSFLSGHLYSSTIVLVLVTAIATVISFRAIKQESLPYRLSAMTSKGKGFKSLFNFNQQKPYRAIFELHFKQVDFSTRAASMGNIRIKVNRVSVYTISLLTTALAVGFSSFEFFYVRNIISGSSSLIYVLFPEVYIAWGISLGLSTGTLSKERAWLAFITIPIENYMQVTALAKMSQALVIALPFIGANIFLLIEGFPYAFPSLLIFIFLVPIYCGINFSMSFYRKTFQITQEDVLPSTYNMSQFILLPVSFILLALLFVGIFFLPSLPLVIIGAGTFLAAVLMNKSHWKNGMYAMVEKGYV
jgi:hypothetical protein